MFNFLLPAKQANQNIKDIPLQVQRDIQMSVDHILRIINPKSIFNDIKSDDSYIELQPFNISGKFYVSETEDLEWLSKGDQLKTIRLKCECINPKIFIEKEQQRISFQNFINKLEDYPLKTLYIKNDSINISNDQELIGKCILQKSQTIEKLFLDISAKQKNYTFIQFFENPCFIQSLVSIEMKFISKIKSLETNRNGSSKFLYIEDCLQQIFSFIQLQKNLNIINIQINTFNYQEQGYFLEESLKDKPNLEQLSLNFENNSSQIILDDLFGCITSKNILEFQLIDRSQPITISDKFKTKQIINEIPSLQKLILNICISNESQDIFNFLIQHNITQLKHLKLILNFGLSDQNKIDLFFQQLIIFINKNNKIEILKLKFLQTNTNDSFITQLSNYILQNQTLTNVSIKIPQLTDNQLKQIGYLLNKQVHIKIYTDDIQLIQRKNYELIFSAQFDYNKVNNEKLKIFFNQFETHYISVYHLEKISLQNFNSEQEYNEFLKLIAEMQVNVLELYTNLNHVIEYSILESIFLKYRFLKFVQVIISNEQTKKIFQQQICQFIAQNQFLVEIEINSKYYLQESLWIRECKRTRMVKCFQLIKKLPLYKNYRKDILSEIFVEFHV